MAGHGEGIDGQAANRGARFIELLGPHRAALERYARYALAARDDAEDVLQTALLLAFRDFAGFSEGTNFRAYAFTYLANEVRNANRRRRARPVELETEPADGTVDVIELLEKEDAYEAVLARPESVLPHVADEIVRALAALPEAERSAFLLRAVAGLKYGEIAGALAIPLGTALTRLHNARARLRRALADYALEHGLIRLAGGDRKRGPSA